MFQKISDHVFVRPYMHYTDRPNIGLVCGKNRALLFDAGNSAVHVSLLKQELSQAGLPMPDHVVLSHWHWDHSFGAFAWNKPIIAGRETDAQLRKMQQWKWDDSSMAQRIDSGEDIIFCLEMIKREYPDRSMIHIAGADLIFDERLTVDLGGTVCELIHARGPHSGDSVICYVPSDRFLFLGDSNGKDLYGQPWHFDIAHEEDFIPATMAIAYDRELVDAYLKLLDSLDFTHCIGGHADVMTREALYHSLTL